MKGGLGGHWLVGRLLTQRKQKRGNSSCCNCLKDKISFLFSVFFYVFQVHGHGTQLASAPKMMSFENSSLLKRKSIMLSFCLRELTYSVVHF